MKNIIIIKSRDHHTHPTMVRVVEEEDGRKYLLSLESELELDPGDDPQKEAWEAVAEIVEFSGYPNLERCRWGMLDPADLAKEVKDEDKCFILIHRFFLNGETMDYLDEEGEGTPKKFASREEARMWINREEEEKYFLSHGEVCRPAYYIVPAE